MSVSVGELGQINLRLEQALQLVQSDAAQPIQPETLKDLLQALLEGGELLQSAGCAVLDPDDLRDYRNLLLRLTTLLPGLEARLRIERARLEAQRSHLKAASAWTEASRSTLPNR